MKVKEKTILIRCAAHLHEQIKKLAVKNSHSIDKEISIALDNHILQELIAERKTGAE